MMNSGSVRVVAALLLVASIIFYSSKVHKLSSNVQNLAVEDMSPLLASCKLPSFSDKHIAAKDLLFDLNSDCYELYNQYDNPDYNYKQSEILQKIDNWKDVVGTADVPDFTEKTSHWHSKGGVVPWLEDSDSRVIAQTFKPKVAPHIVLFVVDDWGFNDAGYQSTYLAGTTPNIDKLASKGIRLTNYYTHELCVPSRSALMTGRYALRFGMHGSNDDEELPLTEVTMAEELKSAGYRTNIIGKWHLGMSSPARTPTYRGFDYFYGYLGGFIDYYTKKYGNQLDLQENGKLVTSERELSPDVFSESLYVEKAVNVIKNHAERHPTQPMFLYFASQLIHTPYIAPPEYVARCVDSNQDLSDTEITYCAMNLVLDQAVSDVTCALERSGMADNTLFVLISDNGGNQLMPGNTYPFRGAKGSYFRGGNSVPAFVYGPGLIPASREGGVYDGQTHVTDWLPTFMGLATSNQWSGGMERQEIDGSDIWSAIIQSTSSPHRDIIHYFDSWGNVSFQSDMVKVLRYDAAILDIMVAEDPLHVISVAEPNEETLCLFEDAKLLSAYEASYTQLGVAFTQSETTLSLKYHVAILIVCSFALIALLYQTISQILYTNKKTVTSIFETSADTPSKHKYTFLTSEDDLATHVSPLNVPPVTSAAGARNGTSASYQTTTAVSGTRYSSGV